MDGKSGVALKAIVEHRLSSQILDCAVRRYFTIISNKIFCPQAKAEVTIITSTLLNLAQIAIDAAHTTTLKDAGSSLHLFMSNQGNRVEATCGKRDRLVTV
jgi:hypothetical protein